ncbi:hypothetical protein D3C78_1126490 [compost metagenome]
MEGRGGETVFQRFHAQAAQQLARHRVVFALGIDHGAKPARVMQPQHALRGDQIEMVVRAGLGEFPGRRKPEAARHAQVQQQQAFAQVHQQVLAAAAHRQNLAPHQRGGRQTQRPAQRLAQASGQNARTRDGGRQRTARDFDFREFGHGNPANMKDQWSGRPGRATKHCSEFAAGKRPSIIMIRWFILYALRPWRWPPHWSSLPQSPGVKRQMRLLTHRRRTRARKPTTKMLRR